MSVFLDNIWNAQFDTKLQKAEAAGEQCKSHVAESSATEAVGAFQTNWNQSKEA